MNDQSRHALLQSLDHAIELLAQLRTPDASCVVAFDALKQARALVARSLPVDRTGTYEAAAPS